MTQLIHSFILLQEHWGKNVLLSIMVKPKLRGVSEAYLEPVWTSTMETFCENS